MRFLKTATFASSLLLAGPVMAADYSGSGNELLSNCAQPLGSYLSGLCLGYISGASYFSPGYCQPQGVTQAQVRDIVLQYLLLHPEIRQEEAGALI